MKPRYSLIVAIVIAIPVVLLILNTVDSDSPGNSLEAMPLSGTAHEQAKISGGPVEANARLIETPEADDTSIVPEGNGAALLQTYCAQCHSVRLLERTRKSHAEWEKILSRMERYSGALNDTERLLVLEHLTASDKP